MGAVIRMMEDGSMMLPASSSRMLTAARNPTGPSPVSTIHWARAWGMFSLVSRKENSTALVMM